MVSDAERALRYRNQAQAIRIQEVGATREHERNAFYLAGQAVVAMLEGLTVLSASIADDDEAYIHVREPVLPETGALSGRDRKAATSIIRALLAGIAADGMCSTLDLMDPEFIGVDAVIRATAMMRRITPDPARALPGIWRDVTNVVSAPRTWAAITSVVELLLQETTVSGRAIAHAMDGAMSFELPRP